MKTAAEEISSDDPLYILSEHAEQGSQGDGRELLTNQQIDQILYGNPCCTPLVLASVAQVPKA